MFYVCCLRFVYLILFMCDVCVICVFCECVFMCGICCKCVRMVLYICVWRVRDIVYIIYGLRVLYVSFGVVVCCLCVLYA